MRHHIAVVAWLTASLLFELFIIIFSSPFCFCGVGFFLFIIISSVLLPRRLLSRPPAGGSGPGRGPVAWALPVIRATAWPHRQAG